MREEDGAGGEAAEKQEREQGGPGHERERGGPGGIMIPWKSEGFGKEKLKPLTVK